MDGNALGISALAAMFLMPLVSLIKKPSWSTQAKQLLGLSAAFVAAMAGAVVSGDLTTSNWEAIIAYIATARMTAETLYTQYFGNTEVNAKLEASGNV